MNIWSRGLTFTMTLLAPRVFHAWASTTNFCVIFKTAFAHRIVFLTLRLKEKSSPSLDEFIRNNEIFETKQWKFDENRIRNKEDMKLWSFAVFTKHFLNTRYEYAISELMMSLLHNFPFNLFHRNDKNLTFQLPESKTCLIAPLNVNNVYSDMFWYGDVLLHVWAKSLQFSKFCIQNNYMGKSEARTSSTHTFAYSYRLLKKCYVKICETLQFHISLVFFFILSAELI